jgi:predicted flap endonuclease-1-like 5' DNA nuclease
MKIIDVEGVGAHYAAKLKAKGVRTTERLLDIAGTSKGRKDLAAASGISEKLILEWVNHADLMRIRGVGEEYSDLLEEAGVDTVKELRNRVPQNLLDAILRVNKAKKLVRRPPSLSMVKHWVAEAKKLPPKVTY